MRVGCVELEFLGHAGFLITVGRARIVIDPYHVSDSIPKADVILITHGHSDHCSIKDIQKIARAGTVVLCPVDCQSTLMKVKDVELHTVEQGDVLAFNGFTVECVPAYTLTHKRHAQQEGWLGYVVKQGSTVLYFAGDTDVIPEMRRLSGHGKKGNTFVTMLPVAGEVVMNARAAAQAAAFLRPSLAVPTSYGAGVHGTHQDAQLFVDLCTQQGVSAVILPKL